MVAHQANVHLKFLRLQFIDLHSTLNEKLLHNKLLLQDLVAKPIPAYRTFLIRDSLGDLTLVICQYCSVKKCSFIVTVANCVFTYSGWM